MREPRALGHAPRNWGEAFAALPPETPAADALSSVFARKPASTPTRRRSLRLPLAIAASLLALACLPILWRALPHATTVEPAPTQRVVATTAPPSPVATTTPAPDTAVAATTTPREVVGDASTRTATALPPTRRQVAKAHVPHRTPPRRARPATPAIERPEDAMEPLYAESARLEALLALASDDRVASATAVALGSDLEARVAGIDAALAQPSLTPQHRLDLWKDRVSALRAYASFESTQRALAAGGERYDAMLVSID